MPKVLMVTGAYYPELSGGGLQCRELAKALGHRVCMMVLTTSIDPALRPVDEIDGVPVHRVTVEVQQLRSHLRAAWSMLWWFTRFRQRFEIVHLHGFSRKSWLIIMLAKVFRKKIVLKLTSAGDDDPLTVRARSRIAYWFYSKADMFWGVSPAIEQKYLGSGLSPSNFRLISNGVDLQRFRPALGGEREALRRELTLPVDLRLALFVGFFSIDKHPELLFDAWTRLPRDLLDRSGLMFVGSASSAYHEVNRGLAERIRTEACRLGRDQQLMFIERTLDIEKHYRAADLFVLPSGREGLPNALLEAMASALPCVVTRLVGVTDVLIRDGDNGLLVAQSDPPGLAVAIEHLLRDPVRAARLGMRARETVENHYSIDRPANEAIKLYKHLLADSAELGVPMHRS